MPVLVGLFVHLLVAALLGAGFEIAARRWLRLPSDYGMSALGGLSFGLLIWLLAYLFVPMVTPYLMAIAALVLYHPAPDLWHRHRPAVRQAMAAALCGGGVKKR